MWKDCLREVRREDHHGLDLGEGLLKGVGEVMVDLRRKVWVSNHSSKTERGGLGGGGWGTRLGRDWVIAHQLDLSQLEVGSGGLNLGNRRVITTGT